MSGLSCFVSSAFLCLSLSISWSGSGLAKDQVTAEQVVDAHLRSLGSPEALAASKTLAFVGTTSVEFIQGGHGNMIGTSMCVAAGKKLAIVLKYNDLEYPGEYFAYNGEEVSVGHISPGQRSPLGDFLYRNNGIMKEGLLGGVFSEGWPLLNPKEKQADLTYHEATIDGRRLHEIEYRSKKGLRDVKIKLYFEAETNRHVRTEYRIRVRDDLSSVPSATFDTLKQGLPDSIYVLTERFDDFKTVSAMTLPHRYTIDYSLEGQGRTFIAKWTMEATQWAFNQTYDERIFAAQK
jgi:hypothetical protein